MRLHLYWACLFSLTLLANCGGGKDKPTDEKKEEEKTETSEKKDETEPKTEDKQDLASLLVGKWELVEAFDPGGEKMKDFKASMTFTKTDYEEVQVSVGSPAQTTKGTWSFNPELKNEDKAINCIMLKNSDGAEYGWNLISVNKDELVLVFTTMPEKRIFKRK